MPHERSRALPAGRAALAAGHCERSTNPSVFDLVSPHWIELDLKASSGPDANDGSFRLWVDGALVADLGALDNSLARVDFVRLGALSLKGGASGTLSWDEFESRRQAAIGP
jgi:hypothetical protein